METAVDLGGAHVAANADLYRTHLESPNSLECRGQCYNLIYVDGANYYILQYNILQYFYNIFFDFCTKTYSHKHFFHIS